MNPPMMEKAGVPVEENEVERNYFLFQLKSPATPVQCPQNVNAHVSFFLLNRNLD